MTEKYKASPFLDGKYWRHFFRLRHPDSGRVVDSFCQCRTIESRQGFLTCNVDQIRYRWGFLKVLVETEL